MAVPRKGSGQLPRVRTPPLGTPAAKPTSESRERGAGERGKPTSIPPPMGAPPGHAGLRPQSYPPASPRTPISVAPGSGVPSSNRVDFGLMTPAARVVDELLCVRPDERVVLVHDQANADVAAAFENAVAERGAVVERLLWGTAEERPLVTCPAAILRAVRDAGATVLSVTLEEGEYDARFALVTATAVARTRHVHMIGVGRKAFLASMMASTGRVFDLLDTLRASMRPTSKIVARSAAGTQLEVEMAPHLRWFANGQVVRRGQFINVPFGALITSPAFVSGTYVADASIGGGLGARVGLLEGRPVRLTFEAGRLRRVECRDIAIKQYVEAFAAEGQGHDRVGLVSLGANLGILQPLGEIVHDENMPGLHLSLGEPIPVRTGATWTSHGQLVFASAATDVDLDGEALIRRGRYVRFV